jgi:hypothetical protein
MRFLVIHLLAIGLILSSCSKNDQVTVTYETTGAISAYSLQYLEQGEMSQQEVIPQSAQDKWKTQFTAEMGDIVYISGKYNDPESALKVLIKVDGKIYKQASNQGDTLRYLVVSGTIPFD